MDNSAVEAVVAAVVRPQGWKERVLAPKGWTDLTPRLPVIEELTVHTLTGLIGYAANRLQIPADQIMLHVVSPTEVRMIGQMEGEDKEYRRPTFMVAEAIPPKFRFNDYLDLESFTVALMTMFERSLARDELATLSAQIREAEMRETRDDGVSQEVTTKSGVHMMERTKLPNPVLLRPFRTFSEVEQPESEFILRIRGSGGGPSIGLFEADGGRWRLDAIENIATFLRGSDLPDGMVVVA